MPTSGATRRLAAGLQAGSEYRHYALISPKPTFPLAAPTQVPLTRRSGLSRGGPEATIDGRRRGGPVRGARKPFPVCVCSPAPRIKRVMMQQRRIWKTVMNRSTIAAATIALGALFASAAAQAEQAAGATRRTIEPCFSFSEANNWTGRSRLFWIPRAAPCKPAMQSYSPE